MNSNNCNFSSTKEQSIKDMTVRDLSDFIKQYVNVQYPHNAIDYWSKNDNPDDKLAGYNIEGGFHHVACYSREGRSEARHIDVCLMLNDGTYQQIARAKTFDKQDKSWEMARDLYEVVEELYSFGALPRIVDFAAALPGKPEDIKGNGNHTLQLLREETSLTVIFDGAEVARYDESDKGISARSYINAYVKDWERIAKNMDMKLLDADQEESATQRM